ncbi:ABC transporter ATP-binding protein [Salinilacihabitans rarus]|uniref:ABC transporter ATP-binding protein n=1 Tax=Salinilacihabitans rarus TaxID=2961596 RepID=UPI0020C8BA1E|nr:ABC transporter ATP-binding protein [Salinilacihabitans rarus]
MPDSTNDLRSRPADDGSEGSTDAPTRSEPGPGPPAVASRLVGEDLEIGYPTTEEPVVDLDRLDLPAGEVTALVGPNGSGKSTLLKSLARQLEPEAGVVYLDGTDVETFGNKAFARRVGLLSQENESPGSVSAEELIYYGRYPHRGVFDTVDEDDREAVERAIELAGVEHLRGEPLGELSGGQKQLVWIAMVLAQETDVLLLDEPTNHLDLHHQLRVMEVVETLNEERGVTVGVVLHDVAQAARHADNLIALLDGDVYDWGPPNEVVTDELLEEVFGVIATVGYGEEGPTIMPHRPVDADET